MTKLDDGKSDSSVEAVIVNFEFDGELITTSSWNPKSKVQDQFLYTIGHLNGDRSVARLDLVELTNVQTTQQDGKVKISYHAKLPVAWGKRDKIPTSYNLRLPRDVSYEGLEAFTTKYSHDCVDSGAHDVDSGADRKTERLSQVKTSCGSRRHVDVKAALAAREPVRDGLPPRSRSGWVPASR